mmetsp:Transcript_37707/g.99725  ORF Transcript_37707/g.99725 Transcript_37707/m.99725 type:complete len:362 (+) Transcript_37707:54-1139(+)
MAASYVQSISYDPKQTRLKTALSVAYTVLPNVLGSYEFWVFFGMHFCLFVTIRSGLLGVTKTMSLDWDFVKVVTAMTTFFEVFYSNQCYSRYIHLYRTLREVLEDCTAFAYMMRAHVAAQSKSYMRLSVRYLVIEMLILAFEIRGDLAKADLERLCRLGVLRAREASLLRCQSPKHWSWIVLNWASIIAQRGVADAQAPFNLVAALSNALLKIHKDQRDILDTLALPVPYQYFHLLSIMIVMNLVLWAYVMALSECLFAPVVFFFSSLIFIGMMELSSELADPFGADAVDFPVDTWISEAIQAILELSEYDFPEGEDGIETAIDQEVGLRRQARDIMVMLEKLDTQQQENGDESLRCFCTL